MYLINISMSLILNIYQLIVSKLQEEKYHEMLCTWCVSGIESLFNKTNCDSSSIDDMLGSKQGVTNQNMIQYLGIIEEKTNQLLLAQTYLANKVTLIRIWKCVCILAVWKIKLAISLSVCVCARVCARVWKRENVCATVKICQQVIFH